MTLWLDSTALGSLNGDPLALSSLIGAPWDRHYRALGSLIGDLWLDNMAPLAP